jgi:antitoxin VapB
MSTKAKLFTNGRSQAVRIPKDFAFKGVDAVTIEKQGAALVIRPVRETWLSFVEHQVADDSFMSLRARLLRPQGGR